MEHFKEMYLVTHTYYRAMKQLYQNRSCWNEETRKGIRDTYMTYKNSLYAMNKIYFNHKQYKN